MTEPALTDSRERLLAETTWDRNVIVMAGAGTGKTTILVNRIINLLMREPHPLAITEIVALTFTNKAATEMKQRLRRELGSLVDGDRSDQPLLSRLCSRYRLTTDQVTDRAATALRQLEKAQIGTLHSFAAHLLRLYPLESRISPSFQEDDGSRFKELFDSQWDLWLADELGRTGHHHEHWRRILRTTGLDELRILAEIVSAESIDLDELTRQCEPAAAQDTFRQWLETMRDKTSRLLAARANGKQLKTEHMLAAAQRLFTLVLQLDAQVASHLSVEDTICLQRDIGDATSEWNESDFADAKALLKIAQHLLTVDQSACQDLIGLLRPFIAGLQQAFINAGWISFDGLLIRARRLLHEHPAVRARIKRTYRAILVDEFQDTDPVQYEIVLYLAEREDRSGSSWQEVELEPGKLFIVGDPKQSIYAFRRADIEAFERVVRKILDGGGAVYRLSTNFRSDASVLAVVNACFDRLFQAEAHIQPPNERLTPKPQRTPELSCPGVQIRLVTAGDEEDFDAAAATRAEAEMLARWIKEELLAGTTVMDRERRSQPVQPGHVALIFRKLTQAQDYLDALRRYDIAYLTDGEKHFYRRQEIVDLVNVLRVLDNPRDRIALVGLLRSPLGGVPDQELLTLQRIGGMDIMRAAALHRWPHRQAAALTMLYERLAGLRHAATVLPVPDVLNLLFEQLPLLELAATSLHGEQAVANLLKARDLAEEVADRPHLTLSGFVDLMMQRLADQPEEAESALAEASLDAVRILTIHKAKGLEFPVVVLPGLHQGSRTPQKGPAVHHDWSSRCYGLMLGSHSNLGAVLVKHKMSARETAEQRRLLYVGMTRARDLLVLSGGYTPKPGRDTVWGLLEQSLGEAVLSENSAVFDVGTVKISRTVLPAGASPRRRPFKTTPSVPTPVLEDLLARHRVRHDRWDFMRQTSKRLTPSLMMEHHNVFPATDVSTDGNETPGRLVGICTHAILEQWDFLRAAPPDAEEIEAVLRRFVPTAELPAGMRADILAIMRAFVASDFYSTMRRATILGREISFVMPWEESQIMEGVIDLMYRLDGRLWIADYKTDRISGSDAADRAKLYNQQAALYRMAATRCLGQPVGGFQFVFLRPGVTVEM